MSRILAIETASSACSVAIRLGQNIVCETQVGNNIHSAVLLSMVDSVLKRAELGPQDLNAIAVGQGPGSFTGLRIGVGVGQGLAFGASCPMIGVCSLDSLALQASSDGAVVAMLDARMGEVYWCEYAKNGSEITPINAPQVSAPELISSGASKTAGATVQLIGNAWQVYQGKFGALESAVHKIKAIEALPKAEQILIQAEGLFDDGKTVTAAEFAPIYVRNDVAKKSTKPLPGRRV